MSDKPVEILFKDLQLGTKFFIWADEIFGGSVSGLDWIECFKVDEERACQEDACFFLIEKSHSVWVYI